MTRSTRQKADPDWLAYAIEVNPWTPPEDLRLALLFRGAIVSAWAAIDTTLSEIALRASASDDYRSISSKYPYTAESKVRFLGSVLSQGGPLQRFRGTGLALLRRYETMRDLRHQMAHASMRVLPSWGITFIDYRPTSDGTITMRQHRYSTEELRRLARKATRLSRMVQRAKAEIDAEVLLPPLPTD